MNIRIVGWAAVVACIFSVAIAVLNGGQPAPQSASAASFSLPNPAWQNQATQPCQTVMNRIAYLQRSALTAQKTGRINPVTTIDDCIAQQAKINVSRCPSDFRYAVARYIAAENTISLDARMNEGGQATSALAVMMRVYAHQSPDSYGKFTSEQVQSDVTNLQDAARQLDRMAERYCVR
jgi:hypothetical protein